MKFCPEKDIYAVVDGDEEDEAETVGFAPRCAVTTICPGRLGGVGLGVGEMVVQPDTTPITAKNMISVEIAPLPIWVTHKTPFKRSVKNSFTLDVPESWPGTSRGSS